MLVARAPSLAQAIQASLPLTRGRARVLRASRLEITLPQGMSEAGEHEPADAMVAALDQQSLPEAIARLDALPPATRIAWAMPLSSAGLVAWVAGRARRLRPVVLEDACDALRHAGVVDVRVTRVDGALPIVVLSGRTSPA